MAPHLPRQLRVGERRQGHVVPHLAPALRETGGEVAEVLKKLCHTRRCGDRFERCEQKQMGGEGHGAKLNSKHQCDYPHLPEV